MNLVRQKSGSPVQALLGFLDGLGVAYDFVGYRAIGKLGLIFTLDIGCKEPGPIPKQTTTTRTVFCRPQDDELGFFIGFGLHGIYLSRTDTANQAFSVQATRLFVYF